MKDNTMATQMHGSFIDEDILSEMIEVKITQLEIGDIFSCYDGMFIVINKMVIDDYYRLSLICKNLMNGKINKRQYHLDTNTIVYC